MAGNQELSGFRLWWRKMRKWVFGILAAAIMGVLLFYPGMAYIYERIGWRSPLLPRPGEEWRVKTGNPSFDWILQTRWNSEDLSQYFRNTEFIQMYNTIIDESHPMLTKEAVEKSYEGKMNETVALVVLEVIDYVDVTAYSTGDDTACFSLAHCRITQILAQRHEICTFHEGESIVVWMPYASEKGNNETFGPKNDNPILIRCGQKSLQLLRLSKNEIVQYSTLLSTMAPYHAPYNIGINYIPIEEEIEPDLSSVSRFLYLPDAIKRYGPTKYWTLDILSKELQDYYDHSSYYLRQ